ncbi:TonB-dependent receptor [Terriglobus albidus]|uniref:TonB-dependent receptor n=2 Tax=Terriglobus albidus TaxID=1592106 RepID=A0A5B9ECS7_9BACT|nr:TonB-dependent receptor [Terriglobus albidus]
MFQKNQLCHKIFRPWRRVSFVRRCRMGTCLSIFLLTLSLAVPCVAQSTTGDIIASVMDPSSAMVPDASLVLTQLETGQQTVLKTDANGLAVFSSLRPGNYKLVASRDGFRRAELNGITVVIGQRANLEVHMQVGDNTESVTVSASQAAMLNSESAAVGQVINQNSIQTLPLNGRNFVQLTQLTTGAAPIGNGNSPATTWTGRSDTTISIAGLRESDTSFLVNGIETRNSRFGNTGIRPSVDAIQEFRVQRTTFGAEFGHAASIVNTELLAGANPFHLVVFALNRNRAYAANTYFAKQGGISQPALNQNNFGATFSGPVWIPKLYNGRNRTFFMFNFEGFRLIQGQTLTGLYPSVAQLQGNLADDSAGTGLFPTSSTFCSANPGSGKCVNIINPQTGQPFAGNVIPSNQLDGTAMKALPFIPKPNLNAGGGVAFPSYNTVASPRNTQTINQYNARLDHRFSDRDSVYATWSNSNDNLFNATINPLGGNAVPLNDHLWTAAYLHTFRPTLVNEFRFGVNDSATFRNSEGAYGPNYAGVLFGLPYANNGNPATYGVPVFGIAGFGSVGSIAEVIGADDKYYQVSDNLTWTHGKLTSMNGLQYIHENFTQITDFASNPTLSYSNGYSTRNAAGQRVSSIGLSDFLLGLPYEVTAASGDSTQYLHSSYYGFYSQNNWKVLPSLTVNLGLRYEYAGSPIESRNRSQFFDTATGQFAYAGSSIRRSIVKPDFNNFAPRIGFAWRPSLLPNTVIRGGVGTYYATDNFNEEQFKNQGSPFYTSRSNTPSTTTPVSIFNPFAGTSTTFPPAHANIFTLDQDNRTPYINQWGLDIQQAFASDYLLELEYAGSSGQKLAQRKNANIGAIDTTGSIPLASRKPFPQYGFILVSSNYGRSNYNALTAKLEKRMSHGNSFLVAYTYSKAIDIGITDDFSSLSRDFFRYDRGVSDYHVPHRLVASYTYQLPFGRGQRVFSSAPLGVEYLIGGWQLNGITTFSSGQYNTPTLAGDNLNIGDFSQSRPDIVGDVRAGRHAPTQWFNAAAFAKPSYGTPGNAGRNSLEQPGYQNWDASLFKSLPLGERANFQLRMEAFNVFNHTQFGHANTSLGPGFGAITSTRAARIVQIGGRLVF